MAEPDELLARADHITKGNPYANVVYDLAAALRAALATRPQAEIERLRQTVRDLCGALDYPASITERFVTGEALAAQPQPIYEGSAGGLRVPSKNPWTPFQWDERVVVYPAVVAPAAPTGDDHE